MFFRIAWKQHGGGKNFDHRRSETPHINRPTRHSLRHLSLPKLRRTIVRSNSSEWLDVISKCPVFLPFQCHTKVDKALNGNTESPTISSLASGPSGQSGMCVTKSFPLPIAKPSQSGLMQTMNLPSRHLEHSALVRTAGTRMVWGGLSHAPTRARCFDGLPYSTCTYTWKFPSSPRPHLRRP